MKYDLSIQDTNLPAHLDIEKDIQAKQNGLFTFILRVNNGNIVDYNTLEEINVRQKYLATAIIIQELTVSLCSGIGGQTGGLGTNNLQRGSEERCDPDSDT